MRRLQRDGAPQKPGIVHLGPGAFFRAFNGIYTDEAMAAEGGDWGIVAVSLRSPTARDQMQPQGGVYTSVTLTPDDPAPKVIGSVINVLVAPENPQVVIDAMAAEQTRIVSLTITEHGYCYSPATKALDKTNPDIAHDLARPDQPRSVVGLLTAALKVRHADNRPAFTVLSCDNLPSNGKVLRQVTLDFARELDEGLADWIADTVAFPCTMVDRITPATTPEDIANLAARTGYEDPACVVHEPFRQWVIEDSFPLGRPAWEAAGAQLVRDVEPHETMKLRCLNGTHSLLAYLGVLAGYETVFETVSDPDFAALCDLAWTTEILPTLSQSEGENLPAYCKGLMERYQNPAVQHLTRQVAKDGSKKLPQRLLAPIRAHLKDEKTPPALCLGVAAWIRHLEGKADTGTAIDISDPFSEELSEIVRSSAAPEDLLTRILSLNDIFGDDLRHSQLFIRAVRSSYEALARSGTKATVAALLAARQR